MDNYEDFYNEPNEFEQQIEEFKSSLLKSIKEEFLEEMEHIREENEKLQDIKKEFKQIKADYDKKKLECDRVISNAEYNAKMARLKEIMQTLKVTLWKADISDLFIEKCEKCNDSRSIKVTLPSGRTVNDGCSCCKSIRAYIPQKNNLYEFTESQYNNKRIIAWYKEKSSRDDDELYYHNTTVPSKIIDHNMPFEDILKNDFRPSDIFFTTLEECQEFCDFYNKKEGGAEYKYKIDGSKVMAKNE